MDQSGAVAERVWVGWGGSGSNKKESGDVAVTDHPEVPVFHRQPAHTWHQRDSTAFRPAQQQKHHADYPVLDQPHSALLLTNRGTALDQSHSSFFLTNTWTASTQSHIHFSS